MNRIAQEARPRQGGVQYVQKRGKSTEKRFVSLTLTEDPLYYKIKNQCEQGERGWRK